MMITLQTQASLLSLSQLHQDAEFVETGASLSSGGGSDILLLLRDTLVCRHQVCMDSYEFNLTVESKLFFISVPAKAPSVARAPAVSSPTTQGSMSFIGASIQTLNVFCPYPWVSINIILDTLNNSLIYIFPVGTSPPISPCTAAAWPRPPPRLTPPAPARHRQTASIPQRRPCTGMSSQQDKMSLLLLSRYWKTSRVKCQIILGKMTFDWMENSRGHGVSASHYDGAWLGQTSDQDNDQK